ncbi:MAG: acyl carrier protein [Psychromonas sp.]|nr:acyl carrier protein [Psychromonas sp.]
MSEVNKDKIFIEIKKTLIELFELKDENIKLDSRLSEDLDLDSIDAVDMIVNLQKITGKKIDPENFRSVRTVEDVVNAVEALMKK